MSDDPLFDIRQWGSHPLPHDDDAQGGAAPSTGMTLGFVPPFPYVGKAFTLAEFADYLASYDFGSVPPEYLVLHHTATPTFPQWIGGESVLGEAEIRAKRVRQLDAIKHYYQHGLGWAAGPHLFVDDRWVYAMTPLADIGIHAKEGNSYRKSGKLHYSIGIEVVGNYTNAGWTEPIAHNVGAAVALLKQRLNTFDYVDGPWAGKISRHANYNKPACPGDKIQPAYYMPILIHAWQELTASTTHRYRVKDSVTASATIRAAARPNAAILGRLHAGDTWAGEPIEGRMYTLPGFGSTAIWVKSAGGGCVWSGLLQETP
jgi:N-acetylmuramoyl-L-alanine amidase.